MRSSLVIVAFFAAGLFFGRFGRDWLEWVNGESTVYALYALMALVGISLGSDRTLFHALCQQGMRLFILPFATIIGTLAGTALVWPLLSDRSLSDCLMVGAGFGYYSLSSVLISESRGVELGTVALISNLLREIATLLFAPLMARWAGPLAPIAAGGATTMDTSLPVIVRFSGKEFIFVAIVHAIVLDFSVPVLVTFFSIF